MNEVTKRYVACVLFGIAVVVFSIGCTWLFFGLSHDGDATTGIKQSVQQLRIEQQQTTDSIQSAENTINDAKSTVTEIQRVNNDAAVTTKRIEQGIDDSQKLLDSNAAEIERGRNILRQIRETEQGERP